MTLTDFVALWDDTSEDSFSADPPNAALTYWDSDATDAVAHTVIVEITGPVSSAGNVLSMKLQILSPSGAVLPTKMYWASLFIDNAATAAPPTAAECDSILIDALDTGNADEMEDLAYWCANYTQNEAETIPTSTVGLGCGSIITDLIENVDNVDGNPYSGEPGFLQDLEDYC